MRIFENNYFLIRMSSAEEVPPPPAESDSVTTSGEKRQLEYNDHLEDLIASEAEKALVLRWLHTQAELRYSRFNTWITLPVITISTLAGTASIGQDVLFGGSSTAAPIGIGIMSLTVSILNVVASFFGWAKRSEGHRISGINYGKLHRWISIELALPRDQRLPAKHFLKEVREQIDRLNETSPAIPPELVKSFRTVMKDIKSDVSLPEVCNDIHCVTVYPGPVKDHAENKENTEQKEMSKPLLRYATADEEKVTVIV
jgi:hypothetical protein